MLVHVLACDYDGTVADHGVLADSTAAVLERVRHSGRKVVLVTGRLLEDLLLICPQAETIFDAIVAENGALLYQPAQREIKLLGDAPSDLLLESLARRGVPLSRGGSILATAETYAEAALAAIRDCGEERTLIFNKGALMLLPGGVTKKTGLEAALALMGLSRHNTVAIGDAENDHAFLSVCECAVAVADAIPALRDRADYVTRGLASRGTVEFIEEHLVNDLAHLVPGLARHALTLGEADDGSPLLLSPHTTNLLIVGPSGSGKSTLTTLLVERLIDAERSVCLLDPEGDYLTLAEVPSVVVLGGAGERTLPTMDELAQLLAEPGHSLALNLSAMTKSEKVDYAAKVLAMVAASRTKSGLPHWIIVDEAHHVFPPDGSRAAEALHPFAGPSCLITLEVGELARDLWPGINAVASPDLAACADAVRALRPAAGLPSATSAAALASGQGVLARLNDGATPELVRFNVAQHRIQHRRHVRKYTEGNLPEDRSFYFRGPKGKLNLRAANLTRFVELAGGVDLETWTHHEKAGDYATWFETAIKDPELAAEVAELTRAARSREESRQRVLDLIRQRYAI